MKYSPLFTASLALLISAAGCGMNAGEKTESTGTADTAKEQQATSSKAAAIAADTGFVKGNEGLDYKIVTRGTGKLTGKPGDYGEMHVKFSLGDTVLINTAEVNHGEPVSMPFQAPTIKGDLMTGLMKMKAGDSVVFRMLMDTLMSRSNQPKPAWAKPGDYAVWEVKMVSVKTKAQVDAETKARVNAQKAVDDKVLQQYFRDKGIKNVKKTATGLYYVIQKPGTGPSPKKGQKVTVNYTGQNLDGKKFDSNTDPAFGHVEPFTFDLGRGSVIEGWDQGVALMNKGMKATFYIPSWMAYGTKGGGDKIPPNAVLIFDIELLNFK